MSKSKREFRNFPFFLHLTPNGCFTVAHFLLNLFQIGDTEGNIDKKYGEKENTIQ